MRDLLEPRYCGKPTFSEVAHLYKKLYCDYSERKVFLRIAEQMPAKVDSPFPIFLTLKEAANVLKCHPRYLQTLVKKKRGPPLYALPSAGKDQTRTRMRFKKSELIQWLEKRVRA